MGVGAGTSSEVGHLAGNAQRSEADQGCTHKQAPPAPATALPVLLNYMTLRPSFIFFLF